MKKLFLVLTLFSISLFAQTDMEFKSNLLKEIIAKAEKDWPGNYRMQEHQINRQLESWVEIQKIKDEMKKYLESEKK